MEHDDKFITELLVEQILGTEPGDLITYSELSALAGVDVQFKYRNLLDKAFQVAYDEHNYIFNNERNIGYRRLTDQEIVRYYAQKRMKKSRSQMDKGMEGLSKVRWDDLNDSDKMRHNVQFGLFATAKNMLSMKAVVTIETKIPPDMSVHNTKLFMKILSSKEEGDSPDQT